MTQQRIIPEPATLPTALIELPQWVCWKSIPDREHPEKKPKKLPIDSATGTAASSTDPLTWGTIDEVIEFANRQRSLAGIGFVFSTEDTLAGVDRDGCRDAETGEICEEWRPWHERLLPLAYTEVSPSGLGIKYWLRGKLPQALKRDKAGVEVYDQGRYFTVTGQRIHGCADEPQDGQAVLNELLAAFAPPVEQVAVPAPAGPTASAPGPRAESSPATGWRVDRARAVDARLAEWVHTKVEWARNEMATAPQGDKHNRRVRLGRLLGGVVATAPSHLTPEEALGVLYGAKVPESHHAEEMKAIRQGIAYGLSAELEHPELPTDNDLVMQDGRAYCPTCSTAVRRSRFDYPGTTKPAWYCPRCKGSMVWPSSAWNGPALVGEAPHTAPAVEPARPRFVIRSEEDLAAVPAPEWILSDEMQRKAYHLIYGASGSGKTFYALDRSMRAASAGARCLYVATEDLAGLKLRVAAWRAAFPSATGRIVWLEMPEGINLADPAQVDELLAAVGGLSFDLITIDTLREAHTGDENSSQDMAAVNRAIQRIIRETSAAVDLVHHSGVNEGRERGSTALSANCDLKLKVSNDDGRVAVTCEKFRHGPLFAPRYYQITPTPQAVGGAVLRPASTISSRQSGPLTVGERSILEMLALSIFEDVGAKTTQVEAHTCLKGGSLFRALSALKNRGYLSQGHKGDPYRITPAGRAVLGPAYQPAPGYDDATTSEDEASEWATTTTTNQLPPTTNGVDYSHPPTTTTTTTRRVVGGGSWEEQWEMVDVGDDIPPNTASDYPQDSHGSSASGLVARLSERKQLADRYEELMGGPPPGAPTNEQLRDLVRAAEERVEVQQHAAD